MRTKKELTIAEQISKKEKEAFGWIIGIILNFSLSVIILIVGIIIAVLGKAVGEIANIITFIGTVVLFLSVGIGGFRERKKLKGEIIELQQREREQQQNRTNNT